MGTPRGFSVRIFIPTGEPEGLRIVEKSNWTGQGMVFPRSLFVVARADELAARNEPGETLRRLETMSSAPTPKRVAPIRESAQGFHQPGTRFHAIRCDRTGRRSGGRCLVRC